MASFSSTISLLLLVLSVSSPYVPRSFSQSPECVPVMTNMYPCLSYVVTGSLVDEPKSLCCTGLKVVLDLKPLCLCEMLKSGSVMGYSLNSTRTSTLPAACNVDAPPVSACGLPPTSSPTTPPTDSPTDSPADSPASSPTSAAPAPAPGY